jgi:hypothetical protein
MTTNEFKTPQERVGDKIRVTRPERMLYVTLAAIVLCVWGGFVVADTVRTSPEESNRFTRACAMAAGSGWTDINCSAGVAYSAALTKNTRYIIQALSGSPYIAVTTAAAGQDADSNDGYLPDGSWMELYVPDAARYVSCDGSADTSRLRIVECQ